ncbi:response regulator [Litoribrevibacter euphylliae]|uniref:histidine kinase n=1 Tax=Litoribrevibacter euphylliae TaxID=1834034 RepID=A0ABV7HF64_9GAMM
MSDEQTRSTPLSNSLASSLAVRIPLTFIVIMLLFVAAFLLVMELRGKPLLINLSNQQVQQTGESMVAQLGRRIKQTESLVLAMAKAGETLPQDDALHRNVIKNIIDHEGTENFIAGGGIWPEPNLYDPDIERRSFFWGRDQSNQLIYYDDYNHPAGSGYHHEEWYVPAKLLKPSEIYWSRSYMDPYSYQSMVTATAPMFRDGRFYGVTTIDLKLEGLSEFLAKESEKFGGYAFALDRNGTFLSHPNEELTKEFGVDEEGNRTEAYLDIDTLIDSSPHFNSLVAGLKKWDELQPLSANAEKQAEQLANDSYQINQEEAHRIIQTLTDPLKSHIHGDTYLSQLNITTDPILDEPVLVNIFHVPDTYWKVITVTPQQRAFAASKKIIDSVLFASFIVLAISLLVGFIIMQRSLVQPLLSMTTQIKHLDLEKLAITKEPAIKNIDQGELGELATQFNAHTKQLVHANSALAHQIDLAKQAADAKSQFLANMSHEIRTPINGVLGMLTLMDHTQLNKQQSHYTSMARSSAESLLTIINDILDFSKIEAGKLDIETIDFDLRSLLNDFAGSIAPLAQRKGLELILDINHISHRMVKGDPGRIRQVLSNLVSNAIKFTNAGEVSIKVKLENAGKLGMIMYGSVSDTGIGIPREKQDQLFKSFSQLDASNTRKYGGTGLGLAISKQLCELMGGGISLISELNQGSQFNFSINLQSSVHDLPSLPSVNLTDTPILLVDDNATNRLVLKGQLESWGAEIVEANNAEEALNCLAQHPLEHFKVAILDMHMPSMNGADLGQKIKEDPRFEHIHLIMMTSMGERGDASYFAELGFSGYFPKPASIQDIYDALSVVLEGGKALETAKPLVTHHHIKSLKRSVHKDDAKILLVEDNLINQQVALGLIERLGYQVDTATNGQEALHYLKTSPPDAPYSIILMDCQMPVMDGYQATETIRSGECREEYKDITIIALTANAMKGDMEYCIEVGMNDYMSKPIDPVTLKEKLDHWLHGKAPAEDSTDAQETGNR